MSDERTFPDVADGRDPPAAAVDPSPPRRQTLARLPPLEDPLARLSAPASTEPSRAEKEAPVAPSGDAPRGLSRLGRLPPFREPAARVSAPETPPPAHADVTIAEPVEEIDLDAVVIAPPSPPPPPAARPLEARDQPVDVTVSQAPRPADTVRDLALERQVATEAEREVELELEVPAASLERTSAATIVEDSAEYYCERCERRVPRAEIQVLTRDGRKGFAVCPVCNEYLGANARGARGRRERAPRTSRAPRPERTHAAEGAPRALPWVLVDALVWPVTRQVLPTLVGLTCVTWLLSSARVLEHASAELAGLLATFGLLALRAAAVIHATHRGDDAPPPLFGDAAAVLRHVSALLVGGAPLLAAFVSDRLGVRSPTDRTLLVVAGIVVSCLYVPAGQIVVAARETLGAGLNPLRPIGFALRVGRSYLVPCVTLLVVAIAHLVAVNITRMVGVALFGGPSLAWGLVASLVVVGGVLVEARVLGLVVREHGFDLSLL